MKDAVATMGGILPDDAGGRDAVHIAVIDAKAATRMVGGQYVSYENGVASLCQEKDAIGIVDPFISGIVETEQRFWIFLKPRTITGLNHNWSHPAFPDLPASTPTTESYSPPSKKLASEQWLRENIALLDCDGYEEFMNAINNNENNYGSGEYLNIYGDASGSIPDEFWPHIENVLGKPVKYRPSYFSCSC